MTDILVNWLNNDVKLSKKIDVDNFAREFSNGYFIGEVLNKYQLQDDFASFSQNKTSESKLNNFTRMEASLALLGVTFNTNIARCIMTEAPGVATRLLYELFIALENKLNSNLTGVAMETMRPQAPAKLQGMEALIFKERLKEMTPRQTDLNLQELVNRFHQHQIHLEKKAFQERIKSAEQHDREHNEKRERLLERTKQVQLRQSEMMAKIQAAIVQIPQPPPNRTLVALAAKKKQKLDREAALALADLDSFEDRKNKSMPPPRSLAPIDSQDSESVASQMEEDDDERAEVEALASNPSLSMTRLDPLDYIKPASNDEYIGRIRRRLQEDNHARNEREKRRRKVLVDCLRTHQDQEELRREEMMANRLMRQSQMERRIAVQLLQTRHEKDILKRNRIEREQQYQAQREREFIEAMNREAEMARQQRLLYVEEAKAEQLVRNQALALRQQKKYQVHYNFCYEVIGQITDFACRIAEYRNYTEHKVPHKFFREWLALFINGLPLYDVTPQEVESIEQENVTKEEKCNILDETDMEEYLTMIGEWQPSEESEIKAPPRSNPIVGWVVNVLHNIVHPPTPMPLAPQFPEFPIKVAIVGKTFSGKSTIINQLVANNRCLTFNVTQLVDEATKAFQARELEPLPTPEPLPEPISRVPTATSVIMNEPTQVLSQAASALVTEQVETKNSLEEVGTTQVTDAAQQVKSQLRFDDSATSSQQFGSDSKSQTSDKPLLTMRAQIGQKLTRLLKKGKVIEDNLLVDLFIDAIKRVPDGTGWILNGFPANYNQAKLFEKALTGYDEVIVDVKAAPVTGKGRAKRISLAPNPKLPPPAPEPVSGLDLVLLFDLDDSQVLKRSLGRHEEPIGGKKYHQEFQPPPVGASTGLGNVEKVEPVHDPANDAEQVQQRLAKFLEAWPKMEKFYQRFGNLQRIDADMESTSLYYEVENMLEQLVFKKNAPLMITASEEPQAETALINVNEEISVVQPAEQQTLVVSKVLEPPPQQVGPEKSASQTNKKGGRSGSRSKSPKGKSSPRSARSSRAGSGKAGSRAGSGKNRSRSGSKKLKSPEIAQPVELASDTFTNDPDAPPPPEPGSEEWIYSNASLPQEVAQALSPLWDTLETGYVQSTKSVFRSLRNEREEIVKYLYQIRKDFLNYLQRPDNKQEFISAFQRDYNEVPEDMRVDEDMIQDLHQRVDDLRDKLYDMTDERKVQGENRRDEIINSGWMNDRTNILSNHYITLMQTEIDRFQDTLRFLKDYYKAVENPVLEEFKPEFLRLPILEIPIQKSENNSAQERDFNAETTESNVLTKAPSPAGKKKKDAANEEPRELTDEEIEAMFRTKIPTIDLRPSSTDFQNAILGGRSQGKDKKGAAGAVRTGGKSADQRQADTPQPPADPDQKLLFDAVFLGCQQISNVIAFEIANRDAEDEAEKLRQAEKEKEKLMKETKGGKAAGVKAPAGGKGGKKSRSPSPKKGKNEKKSDEQEISATPVDTEAESEEEREKREEERLRTIQKEKRRKEYFFAIEEEAQAAKVRMEMIKMIGCKIIADLKSKADSAYKDMFDWIGSRLLKEDELIDQLTEILRHAIETKQKLNVTLELKQDNCTLNREKLVIPQPQETLVISNSREPSRPPPIEDVEIDQFKIQQLRNLLSRLQNVAPSGKMAITEFVTFFQDLALHTQDVDALPEAWRLASSAQLNELAEAFSTDHDYSSWRALLLALSQPWSWPSQQQLLDTLNKFRDLDQLNKDYVTREQYDFMELWFPTDEAPATPTDPNLPKTINRAAEVKRLFFDIFANKDDTLEYVNMLLHFCVSSSPYVGLLKAISVTSGDHSPHLVIPAHENETAVDPQAEEVPLNHQDLMVPLPSLYKALCFGRNVTNNLKTFPEDIFHAPYVEDTEVTKDKLSPSMLAAIYESLGAEDQEPLPFRSLLRHSALIELLLAAQQYKSVDVRQFISETSESRNSRPPTER